MTLVLSPTKSSGQPTLSEMLPRSTDRAAFVGQTGAGKTFLARYALQSQPYVVVHDGKGMLDWPEYRLVRKLRDLVKLDPRAHPRIIYRPNPEEAQSPIYCNGFFRWVYERRNTTLYVDETFALFIGGLWPPYHHACVTRGRERKVVVWSGMQRPSWIPIVILSESEHFYVFRLQWREDRTRMEEVTGLDETLLEPRALPKQVYWYVQTGDEPRGPFRLDA